MEDLISVDKLVLTPTIKAINKVLRTAEGHSHGVCAISSELLPADDWYRKYLYELLRQGGYECNETDGELVVWWNGKEQKRPPSRS